MPLSDLNKVLLSWPSLISLQEEVKGSPRRSWVQLAKTGSFVSTRYGKFSITKDDLSTMLHNFDNITPKDPTELPIDYDHLSMDPKKPGDGIAAGWMKKLELREGGDELWCSVEWTKDGAERIANNEYRFVSPSFVKNHKHKDGKQIGTTLLAAAITNHPFLEGMSALTLTADPVFGGLAVLDDPKAVVALSEVGQRVMIAPGNARTQDEIGGTFEITEVVGDGENAFVTIKDANGVPHKWFRATELLPASATPANPVQPNLQPAAGTPAPGAPNANVPGGDAAALAAAAAAVPGAVPHEVVAQQVEEVAAGTPKAEAPKPGEEPKPGEPKPGEPKPEEKPAAAADAKPAADAAKPGAPATAEATATGADGDKPDVEALIKKKVAAALAGAQPKGIANMMFKLRNDKNEEIEVSAEQLAAAGIKVVPEGSTVIGTAELATLNTSITSLSSRLDAMATEATAAKTTARTIELTGELNRLSKAGLVTKATRDALEAQFKDAVDLTVFRAIAASFTTPVVALNTEHGSGGDAPAEKAAGEEAQGKIIALANSFVKDRGMSLRDATIAASAELAKESEAYREHYSGQIQ